MHVYISIIKGCRYFIDVTESFAFRTCFEKWIAFCIWEQWPWTVFMLAPQSTLHDMSELWLPNPVTLVCLQGKLTDEQDQTRPFIRVCGDKYSPVVRRMDSLCPVLKTRSLPSWFHRSSLDLDSLYFCCSISQKITWKRIRFYIPGCRHLQCIKLRLNA